MWIINVDKQNFVGCILYNLGSQLMSLPLCIYCDLTCFSVHCDLVTGLNI